MSWQTRNHQKVAALFWLLLLGVALALILTLWWRAESGGERVAVITVAGAHYRTVLLMAGPRQEIVVSTPDGFNRFVVFDGGIACVEADCPAQVCRQRGFIRRSGEVIACLPHKVLVEVKEVP